MARVLLVDDEPDILMMLRMAFEDEGHDVDTAGNGQVALEKLGAWEADVVVLDMMMPIVDGWGVLRSKRDTGDATPVIVVSAKSEPKDCRKALELGAVEYVIKPFDIDRLVGLVAEVAAEDGDAHEVRRLAAIESQRG